MTCPVCGYQPSYAGASTCPRCGAPMDQAAPLGPTPGLGSGPEFATDQPAWLAAGETVDRSALRRAREEAERMAAAPHSAAQPPEVPQPYEVLQPYEVPQPYGLFVPRPATIGERIAASLLDAFVLVVPLLVLAFIAQAVAGGSSYDGDVPAGAIVVSLLAYAVLIAYPIVGWARGQTVGMRVVHIELVDEHTLDHVGAGRAFVRYLMTALMGMPCYLGYISILTDTSGYHRGWNDKAANSRMIRVS